MVLSGGELEIVGGAGEGEEGEKGDEVIGMGKGGSIHLKERDKW